MEFGGKGTPTRCDVVIKVTKNLIIKLCIKFKVDLKMKKQRNPIMPHLYLGIPWGFFDGASQALPPVCGANLFLHFNQSHFMHVKYAPRHMINNMTKFRNYKCWGLKISN